MSDFQLEDTLFFRFTTRAFATGIPTVLAGTPAIDIYENDSTTQVVVGESLTVDFDGVVGLNLITITATAASGFEAGKSYCCIIQAGTVGGVSVVGEVVKEFTLDMSAAAKDLANGTDGLGAIKTDTAAILIDVTGINGDAMRGTDSVDTATMRGTDSALLAASINLTGGAVDTVTTLTGHTAQTGDSFARIGAAGASLSDLGGMSTGMKAEVNVEAKDVLFTDTDAEPAQGAPGATVSLSTKIGFLYKAWRNRSNQTATTYQLFNDDATTVDHKATVSDDATTAEKGEVATGP